MDHLDLLQFIGQLDLEELPVGFTKQKNKGDNKTFRSSIIPLMHYITLVHMLFQHSFIRKNNKEGRNRSHSRSTGRG